MKTYCYAPALTAAIIAAAACNAEPPHDEDVTWSVSPSHVVASVGESIPFEVQSVHSASVTPQSHRVLADVTSSNEAVIESTLDVEIDLDGGLIVRTCKSVGDATLVFDFAAYPDGAGQPLTGGSSATVQCRDDVGQGGGGAGGMGGGGAGGMGGGGGAGGMGGGGSPCAPEVEPNDEPMQADDLGVIASGQSACVGLTSENYDVDYATFDVPAGTTIAAVVDGCMPTDTSYEMHLYDADDNLLNYTASACPVVLPSPGPLDAGTYHVRVTSGAPDPSASYLYVQAL